MNKPLTLHIEDVKNELVKVVNNSNLHPFILDAIVGNIYNEVHMAYVKQCQDEKNEYELQKDKEEPTE